MNERDEAALRAYFEQFSGYDPSDGWNPIEPAPIPDCSLYQLRVEIARAIMLPMARPIMERQWIYRDSAGDHYRDVERRPDTGAWTTQGGGGVL